MIDPLNTMLDQYAADKALPDAENQKAFEQSDEIDTENPYEHDNSPNGCTINCEACEWAETNDLNDVRIGAMVQCQLCHEPTNPDTATFSQGAYLGRCCEITKEEV